MRIQTYLALSLSIFAAASGQAVRTSSAPRVPSIDLRGLIHLDVVVTDPAGRPVAGLGPGSFTLLDNGEPRPILSFAAWQGAAQPNPPTSVLLLIDTMGAPNSIQSLEQQQTEAFLRQNRGRLAQPISLMTLSESGLWQVALPSSDGNLLALALEHHRFIRQIRAGAMTLNLPMAGWQERDPGSHPVTLALQALGAVATAERQRPGRKLLLWVGPGWNNGSGRNPDDHLSVSAFRQSFFDRIVWFSTLLRDARITLYSFSAGPAVALDRGGSVSPTQPEFGPPLSDTSGPPLLPSLPKEVQPADLNRRTLALVSGGRVLPPATDLVSQMNGCLREARSFYSLSFDPVPAKNVDEYHPLRIRIEGAVLTARTTSGYYDQPWYSDPEEPAKERVTVAQLEQLLGSLNSESDAEAARRISSLSLTEHFSSARLARWIATFHGNKTRQALVAIADCSALLEPPRSEIPDDPPPDAGTRTQILVRARQYIQQTMTRLPDFFARRTGLVYVETPPHYDGSIRTAAGEPLHLIDTLRTTAIYRNGGEVIDARADRRNRTSGFLSTYGTFGPVLSSVKDALSGSADLMWDRWETGANGKLAVFRFKIPVAQSQYWAEGCCLPDGIGDIAFQKRTGYVSEIAIDPATGAILRIVTQAQLDNFAPLGRSAVVVTYGPVQIGGQTYICPLRSIGIMRSRTVSTWVEWDESFRTWGPWITMLNDFTYSDYHMFRANARILPGATDSSGNRQEVPGSGISQPQSSRPAPQ